MKYVVLTEADSNGISEVFHSFVLPEGSAPQRMIDNWNDVAKNSPIKVITVTNKENIATYSTWDEESETFTMSPSVGIEHAKSPNQTMHVFLIDNIVRGGFASSRPGSPPNPKYIAAFSRPVIVIALEDNEDPIDLGYTYNGTDFFPPMEQ